MGAVDNVQKLSILTCVVRNGFYALCDVSELSKFLKIS